MFMDFKVPKARKNANIVLIHKKFDHKDLKNYRAISLLSIIYKLFTKIVVSGITACLGIHQPGKRLGSGKRALTMNYIHVINQVIEKSTK